MMKPTILVISCEHAVNHVPDSYRALFNEQWSILDSHSAFDFGALDIALHLHQILNCPYVYSPVTRLLIDCNRSLVHQRCFSSATQALSTIDKQVLIDHYYIPYRQQVRDQINTYMTQKKQVLHLSIHTFPAIEQGMSHNAGIGILYDSQRHGEKEVARLWHGLLLQQTPHYRVRMNYPYPGAQDNFLGSLRLDYSEKDYLGLEVECNQALLHDKASTHELWHVLSNSLKELMLLL